MRKKKPSLINAGCKLSESDKAYISVEQYKIFIEMADSVSQRRVMINNFYLTISSALATGILIAHLHAVYTIIMSFFGIMISFLWYKNIAAYRDLNSIKFEIIDEMESFLPLSPHCYERELIENGNDKRKYWPVSHIEIWVARVFVFGFILLVIKGFCELFKISLNF